MIDSNVSNMAFQATSELSGQFDDYRGQWIVLYFYPRDATPGCTTEGQDFRDQFKAFQALNTVIFGISRDNLSSHERFKAKQSFPFELISDPDELLCQHFDVMRQKNMYGKQVRGIERSTFIINPDGVVCHEWRKVKVPGHVEAVLNWIKAQS